MSHVKARAGQIAMLMVTLGIAACRHASGGASRTDPSDAADTSLFAAVVRSAHDSVGVHRAATFTVDPRPILSDETVSEVIAATMAVVDSAIINQRKRTLASLGVESRSAEKGPGCPGIMIPNPDASQRRNCPSRPYFMVAMSLPRLITQLDSHARTAVVHTVETAIGPHGQASTSFDYVMRGYSGHWVLSARRGILVSE